ncbi:hypothetical protein J4558_06020 [Leptolyngbya sp. 15MV]|nr:hypothetical protein J4558_06020 [Leptolyngbya sp. 15MV]
MSHSVFIDGAAGTTGLEIRERLAGRSEFALIVLDEARRKDEAARREALNEADFAVLCLPDEAAIDAVALIDPASKTRVIDASSAHRVAPGWLTNASESSSACWGSSWSFLDRPRPRSGRRRR